MLHIDEKSGLKYIYVGSDDPWYYIGSEKDIFQFINKYGLYVNSQNQICFRSPYWDKHGTRDTAYREEVLLESLEIGEWVKCYIYWSGPDDEYEQKGLRTLSGVKRDHLDFLERFENALLEVTE